MNRRINVDPANPGQFFACCGILELAGRLWAGAEGRFESDDKEFVVEGNGQELGIRELIRGLVEARMSGGLTSALEHERQELETKKRQLAKSRKKLPGAKDQRRVALGKLLREGPVSIGQPFDYVLDWWLNEKEKGFFSGVRAGNALPGQQRPGSDDDDAIPKTWAGSQQVLRIAQAALVDTVRAFETTQPFDFKCVMRG